MNPKWYLFTTIAVAVLAAAFFFLRGDGESPLGLEVRYRERPALLSQRNYGSIPEMVREISIKNMSDRSISLTDFIVNDRPECLKRLRTEPIELTRGDVTYLKPSCDVVQIEIYSDKGTDVFSFDQAR